MAKRRPISTSKQWVKTKENRELHDHYHALGALHARWNVAELQLQRICWFLIAAGPNVGRAVTNEMGNVSRTNLLVTLAQEVLKNSKLVTFFVGIEKLFNANRDNRNFIMHCRVMYASNAVGQGLAIFQRFKADRQFRHAMYVMPIEELRRVADEIEAMNAFFARFFAFLEGSASDPAGAIDRLPSLGMPSSPQSLGQRLLSFDPAFRDPEPPSRGKRKSRPAM